MTRYKYRFLTKRELSGFNGRNGLPAYVAYKNKIYDVTGSFLWPEGRHQGLHYAGRDLTEPMKEAPHEADQLEKFPLVGYLVKDQ